MRNSILTFLLLTVACSVSNAQTDRDYIISKVRVFYIANPTSPTIAVNPISVNSILNNTNVFGTTSNSNMDRSLEFLQQLFRPVSQGGMPELQRYTASILRMNNKIVNMFLFNDFNRTLTAANETLYGFCLSGSSVWPCARHFISGRLADTVSGAIYLGEQYFRQSGITVGRRTFLHELYHTQDPTDRREHIWYVSSLRQSFSYGSDNIHFIDELTPNITATYKEAMANAFTYIYSRAEKRSVINWFAENGGVIVEHARPSHIPASVWLYSLISASNPPGPGRNLASPPEDANTARDYKLYRIADLASKYILHNEGIMGLIAAEYSEKVGYTKFTQALRQTNGEVSVSTPPGQELSPFAKLIKNLCEKALPPNLTVQDVTAVSRAQMPYLYPLALVDYFTYYRTQSEAEFRALFEGQLPEVWVDLYWTAGKDIVRNAAQFTMRNGQPSGRQSTAAHITAIANALQVTATP